MGESAENAQGAQSGRTLGEEDVGKWRLAPTQVGQKREIITPSESLYIGRDSVSPCALLAF